MFLHQLELKARHSQLPRRPLPVLTRSPWTGTRLSRPRLKREMQTARITGRSLELTSSDSKAQGLSTSRSREARGAGQCLHAWSRPPPRPRARDRPRPAPLLTGNKALVLPPTGATLASRSCGVTWRSVPSASHCVQRTEVRVVGRGRRLVTDPAHGFLSLWTLPRYDKPV